VRVAVDASAQGAFGRQVFLLVRRPSYCA